MPCGRLPALIALTVALALGGAPWRVCAHADDDHARVYVLGLGHDHDHDTLHEHAPEPAEAAVPARPAHVHRACGPGCRTHGAHAACGATTRDRGHTHVQTAGGLHGQIPSHDHDAEHPEGECHCGDHPLVPGLQLTPVALDAHAACATATTCLATLAGASGTQEVVPAARPRGLRIACEEDPIVLLR